MDGTPGVWNEEDLFTDRLWMGSYPHFAVRLYRFDDAVSESEF